MRPGLSAAALDGSVIFAGHASTGTWVRTGLNFVVPFLVSNAGLLSARR
jgi:hypothetical protein